MTKTIALAGKGGTGKTTLAALLIRSMISRIRGPILAIDADPATNLHLALGMPMPMTVGEIREDMSEAAQAKQLGVAISRHDYLSRELLMALEEGDELDLIAMGRPEGQGCYCAVNHLLRQILDDLGSNYGYVVVDNEAGMEHISRRTTRDVDMLLIVSDPTIRGLKAAQAIAEMANEIEVNVHQSLLVINRLQGDMPPPMQEFLENAAVELGAIIPSDPAVNELDAYGKPLIQLNGDSPAYRAVDALTEQVLQSM
jgi:CO dehydrogenase maturation factor